jgi:gliding motility-associated-like protein
MAKPAGAVSPENEVNVLKISGWKNKRWQAFLRINIVNCNQIAKKLIRLVSILTVTLLGWNGLNAQSYLEFVENKGQWAGGIKYLANAGPTSLALAADGYRVHQNNPEQWAEVMEQLHHRTPLTDRIKKGLPPLRQESHAWFVTFLGANPSAEMVPEKPLPTYNNYFLGNDQSKWASYCHIYNSVLCKNIYTGVDVRYYTGDKSLKYDIIIQPGTDISKIQMEYKGIEKLYIKKDKLIVPTSVGDAIESIPLSYQSSPTGRKYIDVKFKVRGNILSFKVTGDYDKSLPLVIDPAVRFCSYVGALADNWGFTATYGSDGSVFTGAMVRENGFPVSAGVFDDTYNGGVEDKSDIGIFKFSESGAAKIYATYIGGLDDDQAHSIIADANDNLIIAGRTRSTISYPATTVLGPGGGYDIIISKLNATGSALLGSVRIGGTGTDGVNISTIRNGPNSLDDNYGDNGRSEVNIDNLGSIIVASCSQSNDFFTTPGAFQTAAGGSQDGVVIKMNAALTVPIFSSFLGGAANDAAYVISIDKSTNNIYVAGGTESPDLPGNKVGVYQPVYAGGTDGFLTSILPDGSQIIKTTFLGTPGKDQTYGVQFDRNFFPYVTGTTSGSWPVQNAAYSNAGGKQYITKLQKDLSGIVYSTVFGTNSAQHNISPVSFLVDQCENVYVAGWGGSLSGFNNAGTNGLPITPDALQSTTDGQDIYFFVLAKNATSQLFGSFYGVNTNTFPSYLIDHVDGGTSRFDPRGAVYMAICACSQGNNGSAYPVTAGVVGPTKIVGSAGFPLCNLVALKINFNLGGVDGQINTRDTMGCVPLTVNFSDLVQNAVSYEWNFGDGSPITTGNAPGITHVYTTPGYYRARLIAIDLNSCNLRDTSYINIRVRNDRATIDFTGTKLPPCENLGYQFVNNSVAPPGKPFTNTSFQWDFGDLSPLVTIGTATQTHQYTNPGSYVVKLILRDTNYCNAPDTIRRTISLARDVKAIFSVPTGCSPYNAVFTNSSQAGATWIWDFGDGSPVSTLRDPVHLYTNPGTYIVRLVANDPATCNFTDTMRFTLTVNPTPTADFSFSPVTPQDNIPTQFTNQSLGANAYDWDFGDGDKSTEVNPLHQYNKTGTYNVCLIAKHVSGCADTICYQVPARVVPLIDIANALTPNNDGKNDKVFVRGFGITKMQWRIYNRFGQLVFETTNKNEGWDGRFKGVLQPMDAYGYTLDAEFVDGQKVRKSGDITLIR